MKINLLLFLSLSLFFTKVDLQTIRKEYPTVSQSKAGVLTLYNKLQTITKKDNKVLVAYKGALTTLASKQQKGVKEKKEFFKRGALLIEYAVNAKPTNIEIRLVRLSVQQNAPKFLKYNKNVSVDKAFIFKHLKNTKSTSLRNYIINYILQSKHFTEEEKTQLLK